MPHTKHVALAGLSFWRGLSLRMQSNLKLHENLSAAKFFAMWIVLYLPFYTVKRKATDEECDALTKKPRLEEGTHCSVTKHDQSTLQVHQRGGWALFQVFPHLTMN